MRHLLGLILWLLPVLWQPAAAQWGDTLPVVVMNDRSVTLQQSLYPEYYRSHSARADMRWVQRRDSALVEFWNTHADSILTLLVRYGGIPWVETAFDIYLVRWYPSVGEAEPLIIPLGGMKHGALTEAAPSGSRLQFNIIFQLARRLLAQTVRPEEGIYLTIADHPLMQPGPRRRDNLALLLAVVTAQHILGLDSTIAAYQSAFWERHLPGKPLFDKYLLGQWILSEDRTLADWIAAEPPGSEFVRVSRPPRRRRVTTGPPPAFIEGIPPRGQFGFTTRLNRQNRLVVSAIDPTRVAYANGLREGDIILAVNGRRVRNARDLIEQILTTYESGGATLTVIRRDLTTYVVMEPVPEVWPDTAADTLRDWSTTTYPTEVFRVAESVILAEELDPDAYERTVDDDGLTYQVRYTHPEVLGESILVILAREDLAVLQVIREP